MCLAWLGHVCATGKELGATQDFQPFSAGGFRHQLVVGEAGWNVIGGGRKS